MKGINHFFCVALGKQQALSLNVLIGALIVCFFIVIPTKTFPVQQEDWELSIEKEGVTVHTRTTLNSLIKEFKATTSISADFEKVRDVILDYPNYPLWYENYKSGEIIQRGENGELFVHFIINAPFPVKDRDSVNRVVIRDSADRISITLTSEPNIMKRRRGLIRMTQSSGHWLLTKKEFETEVTLVYHADPKIPIPAWVANRYVVDGPANSLLNLKRLAEKQNQF